MADLPPPSWVAGFADRLAEAPASAFDRLLPAPGLEPQDVRRAAVLILVGPEGIVLTQRTASLRSHAGQVSFPGGGIDPEDAGPAEAAVREAREEVGVRPESVQIMAVLPTLHVPPSRRSVTPVLAWWHDPHPIHVASPVEVERVETVPIQELVDPANRFTATVPGRPGGPGFAVRDLFVWGFTGWVLATTLSIAGVDQPWDQHRQRRVPGY